FAPSIWEGQVRRTFGVVADEAKWCRTRAWPPACAAAECRFKPPRASTMRLARWGLLLSLLCLGTGHAATLLLLDSEPGDYIGGGVLQEVSSPVAAFVGTVSRD